MFESSSFQEAFMTPQMACYATPQQPQYHSMAPVQRPQSSSEVLRSNFYANVQASGVSQQPVHTGYAGSMLSQVDNHSFQVSPVQAIMQSFDSTQMQTPPPTRGSSAQKAQQPAQIAFGTPSTIASRRFMTPQQPVVQSNAPHAQHTSIQYPQVQYSPNLYQFANMSQVPAVVMPQTQLLWEQASGHIARPEQRPLGVSPLKRVGKAPLGSISEHKSRPRPSVILTVDENGNARTENACIAESPTTSIRDRYPGLFDSDTSDDESDGEQPPSCSASFTFAKGEDRRSKAARLDGPVENLDGIDILRSSSRASNKGVTPSRAAIVAAASLRRQASLRRTGRSTPVKRNTMTRSTSSLLDTCPMDMAAEQQQSAGAGQHAFDTRGSWDDALGTINGLHDSNPGSETTLDAHNRRWSVNQQQNHISPQHPQQHVGNFRPAQPQQRTAPLIRCLCGVSQDQGQMMQTTQQLISDLPFHLRSKTSWLTTLCSQHKKLSPLPIVSLWNAIRRDVEGELAATWSRDCPTPAQDHFISLLRRHPWHNQQSKCAACGLQQMADDCDVLVALGAITLATLSSRNWKKSKRVLFFQCLMTGRAPPSHADGTVQKMFELGGQFRELYKGARKTDSSKQHQPDFAVNTTLASQLSPPRPHRSASQDDHLVVTVAALCHSVKPADSQMIAVENAIVHESRRKPSASGFIIPRKPVLGPSRANVFQHAFCQTGMPPPPDVASSVYSDNDAPGGSKSGGRVSPASVSDCGEIIDLYGHSVSPRPEVKVKAASINTPTPVQQKSSEPAKYPRSKLAPITITCNNYGVARALPTSVLWQRRVGARVMDHSSEQGRSDDKAS
ncbi:hypothetical protein LTR08_009152 [Meristemomyces frigidus]|nr:hypothetical protein LTR08_009152 [Meristemomyces frigidus]